MDPQKAKMLMLNCYFKVNALSFNSSSSLPSMLGPKFSEAQSQSWMAEYIYAQTRSNPNWIFYTSIFSSILWRLRWFRLLWCSPLGKMGSSAQCNNYRNGGFSVQKGKMVDFQHDAARALDWCSSHSCIIMLKTETKDPRSLVWLEMFSNTWWALKPNPIKSSQKNNLINLKLTVNYWIIPQTIKNILILYKNNMFNYLLW